MGRKLLIIFFMVLTSFLAAQDMPPGERGPGERGPEDNMRRKHMMIERKLAKYFPAVAEILDNAKKNDPDLFREYERNLKTPGFMQTFHMAGPVMHKEGMKENKPLIEEIITNELKSIKMGKAISEGKSSNTEELKALLNRTFMLKEKLQDIVLKHMAERLDKLKKLTEQRKNMKDKIIEQRFKELTENKETLRW